MALIKYIRLVCWHFLICDNWYVPCNSGMINIYDPFWYMFVVHINNLQPLMFTYHPVDITSHLIVSVSVSRWHKCCASHNSMFVFCLTAHPAFTVIWLLHYIPLMITVSAECLILGCCC